MKDKILTIVICSIICLNITIVNPCCSQNLKGPEYSVTIIKPQYVNDIGYLIGMKNNTIEININMNANVSSVIKLNINCLYINDCPSKTYYNISIKEHQNLIINYSFIPIFNSTGSNDIVLNITVYDDWYGINQSNRFEFKIVPPIAWELLPNSYYYFSNDGDIFRYEGNYYLKGGNKIDCRISNLINDEGISGVLQANIKYGERIETITIDNNFVLFPSSSKIYQINLPNDFDKNIDSIYIRLQYSFDLAQPPNILNLVNSHNNTKYYYDAYIQLFVMKGPMIKLTINQNPKNISIWNGTKLNLTVFNGQNESIPNVNVLIKDTVSPFSFFEFEKYWNVTKISIGDLKPFQLIQLNVTVYSKISGEHNFKASLENKPDVVGEISAFLESGLRLSYINERFEEWNCPPNIKSSSECTVTIIRNSMIGDSIRLTVEIENPNQYNGDFSYSIFQDEVIGITDLNKGYNTIESGKAILNGNGWLTTDEFVDMEPTSISFNQKNATFNFSVHPKMSGGLYMIPYVKSGEKILLFDGNIQRSNLPHDEYIDYGTCKLSDEIKLKTISANIPNLAFICVRPRENNNNIRYAITLPFTIPIVVSICIYYNIVHYRYKDVNILKKNKRRK